jgi:hypothetical protein
MRGHFFTAPFVFIGVFKGDNIGAVRVNFFAVKSD